MSIHPQQLEGECRPL